MGYWNTSPQFFGKFSAISRYVRQRSLGQTVQKLQPIITFGSLGIILWYTYIVNKSNFSFYLTHTSLVFQQKFEFTIFFSIHLWLERLKIIFEALQLIKLLPLAAYFLLSLWNCWKVKPYLSIVVNWNGAFGEEFILENIWWNKMITLGCYKLRHNNFLNSEAKILRMLLNRWVLIIIGC